MTRIARTTAGRRRNARLQAVLSEEHVDRYAPSATMLEDVAAFKDLESLARIGESASEAAHDFRNVLAVIVSCVEAMRCDPESGAALEVEELRAASLQGIDIANRLLATARGHTVAPVPCDIASLVLGCERLIRRVLGPHTRLVMRNTQLERWLTCIQPGMVARILLNLALNARDAMPGGGTFIVEVANRARTESGCGKSTRIPAGDYVTLLVEDTGCGIPRSMLSRVFEPFFTTKAGVRTGLGLASVYAATRESNGFIHVDSKVGQGTKFELFFPASRLPGELQR